MKARARSLGRLHPFRGPDRSRRLRHPRREERARRGGEGLRRRRDAGPPRPPARAGAWASTAWPPTPRRYLLGESGGEQELDDLCRTLEALGQAGVPSCPRPCTWGSTPATGGHQGRPPRGGYTMHAVDLEVMRRSLAERPLIWWSTPKRTSSAACGCTSASSLSPRAWTSASSSTPPTRPSPRRSSPPYAGRASWTPSPAPTAGCSTASGRATVRVNIYDDIRAFGAGEDLPHPLPQRPRHHPHPRRLPGSGPRRRGHEHAAGGADAALDQLRRGPADRPPAPLRRRQRLPGHGRPTRGLRAGHPGAPSKSPRARRVPCRLRSRGQTPRPAPVSASSRSPPAGSCRT